MTNKQPSFFAAWLRQPGVIGAIQSSSRALAAAMTAAAGLNGARVVVEFGAGTGAITRTILRQLAPHARLLVFETNPAFQDWLRSSFRDPRVTVVSQGAAHLSAVLTDHGIDHADCILSGIPFQALPPAETRAILQSARRSMAAHSTFVAFQYTAYQEPTFRRAFDQVELVRRVWWNLPPARVYRCRIANAAEVRGTERAPS